MPVALERKLSRQGKKEGLKGADLDAYIYGTLRKTGWKPGEGIHSPSNAVADGEVGGSEPQMPMQHDFIHTYMQKPTSTPSEADKIMADVMNSGLEEAFKKRNMKLDTRWKR